MLLVCPQAEPVVSRQRLRHDAAARDGVPAHVTVLYPFKPLELLDDEDHRRLEALFATADAFVLRGSRTGWFDDRVVFVAPDDPAPVRELTARVVEAFPDFPPYRGAFAEVIPHLTIGHDHPIDVLRRDEQEVQPGLPFDQPFDHVELWSGPAVDGREDAAAWRSVRSYPLRSTR